ncbi:xanthine dehydrogenase family protein molybdopterin-binding subunit [Demetria terragena]|uniref:xanthine dehydrogenase family protein molybdopterin-binding subunit n=1 Tax=Demetria terragena TaxID=63959 RepID=UPI00035C0FBE|nr:xanthine dehydrogenase family protein molybdopterin-binding subunit [Demetria terragena]
MTQTTAPTESRETTDQNVSDVAVLGAPRSRRDGPAKAHGEAPYANDYPHDNLSYGAIVHAVGAHGRIRSIDTSEALALTGVLTVVTHLNAPRLASVSGLRKPNMGDLLARGTKVDYLNTDEVHYDGQAIAVVVAETAEIAAEAAELVTVDLEPLSARIDLATERHAAKKMPAMPYPRTGGKKGDAKAALAQAPVSVDLQFSTPEQNHNAMELHGCTARWDGDHLTLWDGTQGLEFARKFLAARFRIGVGQVRIVSPFVGGGFGGKGGIWAHQVIAAMAAREVDRPVRLALSREGVYRTVGGRPQTLQRVALGATQDGQITSIIHEVDLRNSTVGGMGEQVVSASADLYASENILLEQRITPLNRLPQTFMRAPGESVGTFALESAVDELAESLQLDPVELRLRNQPEHHPLTGNRYSHHTVGESLRLGAELFGWSDRGPAGSMRDGNHLVGYGVASAVHPAMTFKASLTLRLHPNGRLLVRCGFHDMGMGTATATAQMAAHLLGIDPDEVDIEYGTTDVPYGPMAGGSMQSASIAQSLIVGIEDLQRQLEALGLGSHGAGSMADAIQSSGAEHLEAVVGGNSGLGAVRSNLQLGKGAFDAMRRWSKAASGAQFCEVRIDADTGETRVTRWLGVFDIGRVINHKLASSQLRGGIIMGLGLALMEQTLYDPRTGRIVNPSLTEYHIPVHADVPAIDIHMHDDPDPTMPLGVVGAGEVGITGVGAAVANAVYHATGQRVRDLPITLDRVLPGLP